MLKYRALEETMTKFDLETNEGANIRIDSEYLKPYKE